MSDNRKRTTPPKFSIEEQIAHQASASGCVLRGWEQIRWYFGGMSRVTVAKILKHYRLLETEKPSGRPVLSVDAYRELIAEKQGRNARKPIPPLEAALRANKEKARRRLVEATE